MSIQLFWLCGLSRKGATKKCLQKGVTIRGAPLVRLQQRGVVCKSDKANLRFLLFVFLVLRCLCLLFKRQEPILLLFLSTNLKFKVFELGAELFRKLLETRAGAAALHADLGKELSDAGDAFVAEVQLQLGSIGQLKEVPVGLEHALADHQVRLTFSVVARGLQGVQLGFQQLLQLLGRSLRGDRNYVGAHDFAGQLPDLDHLSVKGSLPRRI